MTRARAKAAASGAALAGLAAAAYWPALRGGFIFDDPSFLTDNPLIRARDGLARFWFTREAADYWPVSSSSLWIEWRAWGDHPAGYHVTNVALYVLSALLFLALLRRLRIPGAFAGALVFALHPLNVASVCWIAERKNLMALLFFLLALLFWSRAPPGDPGGGPPIGRPAYALSLGAFVLAMLSKGSVAFLPLVLLGIVAWHRRPRALDFARLGPFLVVAAGLTIFEARFSTVSALPSAEPRDLLMRLLRAAAIVWFYAGKVAWPAGLCLDYGLWRVNPADPRWWLPLAGCAAVSVGLWRAARRRRPDGPGSGWRAPAFLWAYFCVALLPALGFVDVGFMKYSPVSDAYAQLALLGPAAGCGAAWAALAARPARWRGLCGAGGALAVAALAALTWNQSRIWSDAERLYRDVEAHNPASWLAPTNLGVVLAGRGETRAAIEQLSEAVRLKPDFDTARNDLGAVLYQAGDVGAAIDQYRAAIRLSPNYAEAHNNLGAALARSGRLGAAIAEFRTAIRIDPAYAKARANLARAEALFNAR